MVSFIKQGRLLTDLNYFPLTESDSYTSAGFQIAFQGKWAHVQVGYIFPEEEKRLVIPGPGT